MIYAVTAFFYVFQYSLSVNQLILNTILFQKLEALLINSVINNIDVNMHYLLRGLVPSAL